MTEVKKPATLFELQDLLTPGADILIDNTTVQELFGRIDLTSRELAALRLAYGSEIPRRILYHSQGIMVAKLIAWGKIEGVSVLYLQAAADIWCLRKRQ